MKRVREINWFDKRYKRAGVLPVTKINGINYYAFGVENGVGALGDFGGHIEIGDYNALYAAVREYEEESLNVFGKITPEMLENCYVLDGKDTAEILLPVNVNFYDYTLNFRQLVSNNINHEIQDIVWLSSQQLLLAIDSQYINHNGIKIYYMYEKILETLLANREFI